MGVCVVLSFKFSWKLDSFVKRDTCGRVRIGGVEYAHSVNRSGWFIYIHYTYMHIYLHYICTIYIFMALWWSILKFSGALLCNAMWRRGLLHPSQNFFVPYRVCYVKAYVMCVCLCCVLYAAAIKQTFSNKTVKEHLSLNCICRL